jgi:hypothetical protein
MDLKRELEAQSQGVDLIVRPRPKTGISAEKASHKDCIFTTPLKYDSK